MNACLYSDRNPNNDGVMVIPFDETILATTDYAIPTERFLKELGRTLDNVIEAVGTDIERNRIANLTRAALFGNPVEFWIGLDDLVHGDEFSTVFKLRLMAGASLKR